MVFPLSDDAPGVGSARPPDEARSLAVSVNGGAIVNSSSSGGVGICPRAGVPVS
jgi:hypothetical protein